MMRWLQLTIAIVTFAAVVASSDKQPLVRITLREKVTVANATVQLGDIAEVVALSEEGEKILQALQTLSIAPAPLPRYQRVISAGEVATKLAQAGWRTGDFVLDGSKQVLVVRSGRTLTATELELALQKALNVPVKLLLPPPPVVVPEGELTVQAEMPPSPRAMSPVNLFVNGQFVSTLKLLVQVAAVSSGQTVTSQSVTMPIHLPTNFAVRRRQTVRLTVRVGNVLVEAQGLALQDGKVGDEVLVALSWSKTPIKGIVSGEREVTVAAW